MRVRSISRAGVLGVALTCSVAPALAEPRSKAAPPVVVVAIRSDDDAEQAEALTAALRNRLRAVRGYSLGEGDHSLEVLTLALECGDTPDEACQKKMADHMHCDRHIWGVVTNLGSGRVSAELQFFVRGQKPARADFVYSDGLTSPGNEALKRVVDDALAKLFAHTKGAVLVKSPVVREGRLYIDGEASGTIKEGEVRLDLPVGIHHIEVHGLSLSQAATVEVRADETVETVVRAATPDARPPSANATRKAPPAPSVAPPPVLPASDNDNPRTRAAFKLAGYASLGIGVALLGAGAYSLARVYSIDNDTGFDRYRQGFGPDRDVCDEARSGAPSAIPGAATPSRVRDLCGQASTWESREFVFLGFGAISTGLGAYWLFHSSSSAPASTQERAASSAGRGVTWALEPSLSPTRGGASLRLLF